MFAYCLPSMCLPVGGGEPGAVTARARRRKVGPCGRLGQRAVRRAAFFLSALCSIALLLTTGCQSQDAILLLIRPPSGVQLSQYEVKIQDRDSRTLVYQSGIQPVAAVSSGRDLFAEPLRVGLKLSKAGVALVDIDPEAQEGRLLWLFPPKFARKAD